MTQSRTNWEHIIDRLEEDIRAGQTAQARKVLSATEILKAPRAFVSRLSSLARRAQFSALSLRLLLPYIHPRVQTRGNATPEERLEYAYALQVVGAKNESVRILEGLTAHDSRAHLALVFHYLAEWDYSSALMSLQRLLEAPKLSPYERSVIEVKRLRCLVGLEEPGVEALYEQLMPELRKRNFHVLAAHTLEIMAQYWLQEKSFARARQMLTEAQSLILDRDGLYRLFNEKWTVVTDALEHQNPENLDRLRQRALAFSHWETLRDLDYYRSVLNPEGYWADWVYFGTPYPGFRAKLEKLRVFPESTWVHRQESIERRWDPWFPDNSQGDLAHRFVAFLAKDHYRPARIGEVFLALFPDQYFDIDISPNRVHQIARRARQWLLDESIPLRLEEQAGTYRLQKSPSIALMGRKNFIRYTKTEFIFDRFRHLQPQTLNLNEWSHLLGFSEMKTKRLLKYAQASGLIEIMKHGQYSNYVLKSCEVDSLKWASTKSG